MITENYKETGQSLRETITVGEAADLLGLSKWTLYDLAKRHLVPHIRIGHRVLFRRTSILMWLDEQEVTSLGQAGSAQGARKLEENKVSRLSSVGKSKPY